MGVLALLAVRFGSTPVLDAFRAVDPLVVLAAVGVAVLTTVCCAWRWCAVAAGLGLRLRIGEAVPAYFRSQLLNATLPGGVLGDVDRGLRQRSATRATGLRTVAWERVLGQVVQVLMAVAVLTMVPSPLTGQVRTVWRDGLAGLRGLGEGSWAGALVVAGPVLALVAGAVVLFGRTRRRYRSGARRRRILAADWRGIRAVPRALPVIAVTSVVAVCGHVVVFLLAARSVNPDLRPGMLVPMALLVLVVGALPVNLAGWGPREGAAAWVFGLAGLGGAQGLSVSVLYGVLALVGTLPGVLVLLTGRGGARHGREGARHGREGAQQGCGETRQGEVQHG